MNNLTTDRLILRNFRREDATDLLAYLRYPVASCFIGLKLDDLAAAEIEAEKRGTNDEYIAVCLAATYTVIGDVFAISEEPDTYGVGWNFNPAFTGSGYAFEAAQALFRHLFRDGGEARRVYAYVEDHNSASRRLCERLGMRQEGLFQEFISFRDDDAGQPIYENTIQYALLRKEYNR
ncbi:MAG: N-acetyltransferase [Hyphomicrobiales bacterium]|nr:MAG: N-acetyltransferase [Hyphomicrobiales bacterium]